MADVFKVLGQSAPGAATDTDLYTVPNATFTTVSTLTVCERGGASGTFRIAVRPKGAAISNEHYIYYDTAIAANVTTNITIGMTLASGTIITVQASTADMSFNLFGVETS